jgi:hypothetical protein
MERLGQATRAQRQIAEEATEMELHGISLTTPGIIQSTTWKKWKRSFLET